MATHGGDEVQVLQVGGYDVLGTRTDFDLTLQTSKEKTTVLGQQWDQFAALKPYGAKIKSTGFYDDAAHSINLALVGLTGTSRVLVVTLAGNTQGGTFTGAAGTFQGNYQRVLKIGALHKANADLDVSGAVEEGIILLPSAVLGSSPSSDVDNGASSAFGASGYLSVPSLTLGGYTSVTVVIQTSPDGSTWTDKITFVNTASALTAQRIFVAGTIDRHARVRWVWNGSGSGNAISIFVGLARLTANQVDH